jgi:hypothetical protein
LPRSRVSRGFVHNAILAIPEFTLKGGTKAKITDLAPPKVNDDGDVQCGFDVELANGGLPIATEQKITIFTLTSVQQARGAGASGCGSNPPQILKRYVSYGLMCSTWTPRPFMRYGFPALYSGIRSPSGFCLLKKSFKARCSQ